MSFQVLILIGIFCWVQVWQMAEFDLLGTRQDICDLWAIC